MIEDKNFDLLKPENKKVIYFFLFSLLMIILDQVTKLAIKGFDIFGFSHQGMALGESNSVIGSFLQITFIENEGMAFGISFGAGKLFLSLFSVIASVFLCIYLNKLDKYSFWLKLGIALILAGAVGNLIDRVFYGIIFHEAPLFYGSVIDFIQVDIPDINIFNIHYTHWPIFNVADSCVTSGVIILLIFHRKIPPFEEIFKKKITKLNENISP